MTGSDNATNRAGVYLRYRHAPSHCVVFALTLLAGMLAHADETATVPVPREAPAGARQLDAKQPVWVDADAGRVYVDGFVTLREGVLEMFACPAGTKEHESIVAVDAPAMLIHTALLAVGAEPGTPVRFQPDYKPPTGTEIVVSIEWTAKGESQSAKAQDWIRNAETGEAMKLPFVFAGSGFWTDPDTKKNHYLAEGGDLICVTNFGAAMLDVPAPSTQVNDELWFEPFTERIPPVDTPVRLVLKPILGDESDSKAAASMSFEDTIKTIHDVQVGVGSTESVQTAWQTLAATPMQEIPRLLDAMKGASPLAENWLRSAVDAVADRADADLVPMSALVGYINDTANAPRVRRSAYEVLRRYDPTRADVLLDGALDDPSPEIRYDAVAKLIRKAEVSLEGAKVIRFRQALKSARSFDQLEAIEKALEDLGVPVVLTDELGFVTAWRAAGPFDNRDGVGFDKAYPPEAALDVDSEYTGQDEEGPQGPFGWKNYATSDRLGEVQLNDAIGLHKGAVGYAWAVIVSDSDQPIEIRYQSVAATKVWLNGQLVAENEIYHSGSAFDQYVTKSRLKPGENQLLVKVCQNEQTESWAQTWPFALRITGPAGKPLNDVSQPLATSKE